MKEKLAKLKELALKPSSLVVLLLLGVIIWLSQVKCVCAPEVADPMPAVEAPKK